MCGRELEAIAFIDPWVWAVVPWPLAEIMDRDHLSEGAGAGARGGALDDGWSGRDGVRG